MRPSALVADGPEVSGEPAVFLGRALAERSLRWVEPPLLILLASVETSVAGEADDTQCQPAARTPLFPSSVFLVKPRHRRSARLPSVAKT